MNLARAALVSIVLMGCTQAEAVKSNTDTNPALAIEKRSDAAIKADRTRAVASALPGIDVSHFQDNIDWPAVKKTGVVFTYIKASGGECYDACMDVEYVRVSIKPAGFLGTQKEQGAHAEPDGPSPIIFVHAFDESRAQTVADFRSGSDIWTELHGDTLDPIADIVPAGMTSWVHEIIEEEIQKEGV